MCETTSFSNELDSKNLPVVETPPRSVDMVKSIASLQEQIEACSRGVIEAKNCINDLYEQDENSRSNLIAAAQENQQNLAIIIQRQTALEEELACLRSTMARLSQQVENADVYLLTLEKLLIGSTRAEEASGQMLLPAAAFDKFVNYSLKGLELGKEDFPEQLQQKISRCMQMAQDISLQDQDCERLLGLLRQRLLPASAELADKLINEEIPALFLGICRFAKLSHQERMLHWLTGEGFRGFKALGFAVVAPQQGQELDSDYCSPAGSAVAPSPELAGKIYECICPGLLMSRNSGKAECVAQAEVIIYT